MIHFAQLMEWKNRRLFVQ